MPIFCRIHGVEPKQVLAACDSDILGKTFEEGELFFEVKESFYGKKEVSEKKLGELLDEFGSINLVGEKTVGIALRKGLISESGIIRIKGIPHAQIYRI